MSVSTRGGSDFSQTSNNFLMRIILPNGVDGVKIELKLRKKVFIT
jgi:hypothetical protein